MGTGDELKRQENPTEKTTETVDEQTRTFKTWTDSYRKGNIVDLYLNKSGYDKDQQVSQPDDSQSSKSWQKWFDSDDQSHTTAPVTFKTEEERKKAQTQAREIKTRTGVGEEEALALKAWLDWYEAGDAEQAPQRLPATEPVTPRPDVQAREIKTRAGVREEEALAVKTWLDWYEAGDDPANQIPVEKTTASSSDAIEKELRTRTGVQEEEAKAVRAWTEFYNAGDFLDAYLEKSGY